MRVLVACEFSGVVRDAFRKRGHDAWSCDLLEDVDGSPFHIQGDLFEVFHSRNAIKKWDLMIAHPPCTAVCLSGNRWYAHTMARFEGAMFIRGVWGVPIDRLCIENPVGVLNSMIPELPRPQYIQPWQFGHPETKKTGLWLRGLPELEPTKVVEGRKPRVHFESPGKDRWRRRSITLPGIAEAMADQWGGGRAG